MVASACARHMRFVGSVGSPRCPRWLSAPGAVAQDHGLLCSDPLVEDAVRCVRTQVQLVRYDARFLDSDTVHDETSTERKI